MYLLLIDVVIINRKVASTPSITQRDNYAKGSVSCSKNYLNDVVFKVTLTSIDHIFINPTVMASLKLQPLSLSHSLNLINQRWHDRMCYAFAVLICLTTV